MGKVKINKLKNEVLLSFNADIYKKEFIDQSILDFGEICDIKKTEDGLLLTPKKNVDVDVIGYEFYNYVLSLMKNR